MRYADGNHAARLEFDIFASPNMFGYDLRIGARGLEQAPNGDVGFGHINHIAQPIEFKPLEKGQCAGPCIHLDYEDLQRLMDSLWARNIRPSDGEGSVGQIGALKDQVSDMKKDKAFYQDMIREAVKR